MSWIRQSFRKHRHRIGLAYFAAGVLAGIIISRIAVSPSCTNTTQASLASSSIRARGIESCRSLVNRDAGWNLIHVFFGNTTHIADNSAIPTDYYKSGIKWFSQLRQDEVVSALLRGKRNGYFVDLASNDAIRISNTFALERDHGWTGLCIEPNGMYWAGLSYRKCHAVGAVVGANSMEEVWFKFPNRAGPQGGIVGRQFDNKAPSKFDEDRPRYTVTLLEIFERFQTPRIIDYLSLDVEGAEDFIMKAFPFAQYRFNILTVERPSDKLKSTLEKNGYILLRQLKNWGETLWIHKSIDGTLDTEADNKIDTDNYKYREKAKNE